MRTKLWFGAASVALMMTSALTPASAQQAADPAGDASTEARFAAGQAVDGEVGAAGDVDWYRMQVEQGQRYSFTLEGVADAEGNALDPMLAIYDAQGNQVAFNDDANGLNSALSYVPSASGEIFVEARAFSDQATGAYRLNATAAPMPADDAGNDASTRARISAGRTVNGNLEYEGDLDWYRLSVRQGQRYTIDLAGVEGGVTDPLLRVLDADGNELAYSDDTENSLNSQAQYTPRENGEVFVEARAYSDAYTGAYTLNVSAERMPTDSISANRGTRGRIAIGGALDGSLDFPTDTDWYRVRLTEGQSYHFTLTGGGDSALSDPMINLYDRGGPVVATDDDGGEGLNSYLEFTAPATGDYFIEARGFGEDMTGGYHLAALAGDIPADASTDAGLSADGDYREGMLSPGGDVDWYRVDLTEGQVIRVDMVTTQTEDALGDPYLTIRGPDGAELASDDDGGEGLNSQLEFQAPAAGAYFIEARGFTEDAQGRYALSLSSGEIGNSAESAEYLQANGEGRSSLIGTPDDTDWFAIELVEGRSYRFNLVSAEPNPLADPNLVVYDAQGAQVAADDDGGTGLNSYLSFATPTGGTYYLAVSSYGASGTGRYLLTAVDTDVPGTAYSDEVLDANDDSRISRIEMPGDLDSYRVSLEAGVHYTISVSGHGTSPLADPFVAVLHANITEDGESDTVTVASDDDSGPGLDARLRFTPDETGEFYIQASGLGGSTGDYQVQIVRQ